MSSSPEFVTYIADLLSDAGQIDCRKMFGEYGVFCNGKLFGVICDSQLYIKITKAGQSLASGLQTAPPYKGAKDYFLIEDTGGREFLSRLVTETCAELPEPKPKKRKTPAKKSMP